MTAWMIASLWVLTSVIFALLAGRFLRASGSTGDAEGHAALEPAGPHPTLNPQTLMPRRASNPRPVSTSPW
jgi:hypothetical protein